MINVEYPALLDLFRQHLNPKRSESASFLIWYLENYYRLDTLEAVDAVCDQNGDKGVDGIYINDADNTIDIFQSRISTKERLIGWRHSSQRVFWNSVPVQIQSNCSDRPSDSG